MPSPAANLACDEALLDACEEHAGGEVLRFWESPEYFVVVGYSNHLAREVDVEACRQDNIAILRRCSGGGTVLQGPGCLNYSLILRIDSNEALQTITGANRFIMHRHREAISQLLGRDARVQGHTDLSLEGLKFSGNAQRRQKQSLLFHGTFLYNFDHGLMEKFLRMPTREPDYREHRSHDQFVMNLPLSASSLKSALCAAWSANAVLAAAPDCTRLVADKYSQSEWNLKF